jgi:hypothetical protein
MGRVTLLQSLMVVMASSFEGPAEIARLRGRFYFAWGFAGIYSTSDSAASAFRMVVVRGRDHRVDA